MATKKGIATIFGVLTQAGCRVPPEFNAAETLPTWEMLLGDISDQDLFAATIAYCRSPDSAFWPTPGKLLALRPGAARRLTAEDADAEWGYLLGLVGRYGWPNPPGEKWQLSTDPARNAALQAGVQALGGWRSLCALEQDGIAAARASFRAAYRAHVFRLEAGGEEATIVGLIESKAPQLKALTGGRS
jgi:hypothetical protein